MNVPHHPEEKLALGRHLGPSTNVGPAIMTAKTLKHNGQRMRRATLWGLTEDEAQDQDETKARKLFDKEIERPSLGPSSAKPEDFGDHDDIELANPDLCEDDKQKRAFATDRDNLPDNAINCIGTKLPLQKGKEGVTAQVKRRKLASTNLGTPLEW